MDDNDRTTIVALLLAALLVVGGGFAITRLPRGIKNNNPGNIRRTGINWRGEVPDAEKTDPEFEQFIAPEWGIRAIVREIRSNLRRGEDTIREIITEWAPPSENPTARYIANVAERTGLNPDQAIDDARDMPGLVGAIILQENGTNPYTADMIALGIRLA